MIDRCMSDFKCCRWSGKWDVVNCHCNNDFVYSEVYIGIFFVVAKLLYNLKCLSV